MTVLNTSSETTKLVRSGVSASPSSKVRPWLALLQEDYVIKVLSVLALIALWYLAASRLPSTVMPPPHKVVDVLWEEMWSGQIWGHVAVTLRRISIAFMLAMSVSLILGFAMGMSKTAERFFEVWILTAMIVPSLVLILTIYMVVGLNDTAAVIGAALPVIPIVTINIWESIKAVDTKLIDMSKVYRADKLRIVRSVITPQIAPTLFASARFGLGLVWKTVLFVELLGRSDGIGYQIQFYYQLFNMSEVLAHALLFLIIMLVVELGILSYFERRFFKWRPTSQRF
jgi:NitT/TauT family transport system permease protein